MMTLQEIIREIDEAIFPSNIYCEVCGALIDRSRPYSLCDDCVMKMHWITGRTCGKCGKALPDTYSGIMCYDCMEMEHFFSRGWSCLTYGMFERELMMGIKYSGRGYLAVKMGDVMFDRMEPVIEAAGEGGIRLFDMIIPVPVSNKRIAKRGYNQSELMARRFHSRWREYTKKTQWTGAGKHVPAFERRLLTRNRETEMLRSLNPAERRLALKDAFGVKPEKRNSLKNRVVLLVDDIYTTGATADACSSVLLDEGADSVYLLTLCSGGNRKPDVSK